MGEHNTLPRQKSDEPNKKTGVRGRASHILRSGTAGKWIVEHDLHKWSAAVLFLGAALYVLLYYITGPAISYLHSDCTDSLLWSQMMVESGQVFAEDFYYAALLPFGSPLWMVPVLSIFGYTMTAQVVSMAIFAVLFVLSAFSLLRAMKWDVPASAAGALLLSLLLSGSVKLREIMWEHVIYYGLGILLLMLVLNLCLRLMEGIQRLNEGGKCRSVSIRLGLLSAALLLLSAGCGTDGFQILSLSVLPVLCGYVAVVFLEEEKLLCRSVFRKAIPVLLMGAGMIVGLQLLEIWTHNGAITAGYEAAYSGWTSISEWWSHAEQFLVHYLTLFGVNAVEGESIFSLSSMIILLKLAVAMILLVCPFLLLFRYSKLQHRSAKLVAWTHCFLAAVIILGYICGGLSVANWRLTPLLGSNIIATLVYFWELWNGRGMGRRMAIVMLAALALTAACHAGTILNMPDDAGGNQAYVTVAQALEEKGYDRGYATFWNAGNTTLLSDGAVTVITVEADSEGVHKRRYQTKESWYDSQEGRISYFLMLTEHEYETVCTSAYWKELNAACPMLESWQCEGFYIFVFSENPIME